MTDQKVKPGQFPTAAEFNRHVDVSNWYHEQLALGGGGSTTLPGLAGHGSEVRIKNMSGAKADRFDALGISGVAIDPTANLAEFRRHPVFTGSTPSTSAHTGKWVLCLEPIPDGEIGRAVCAGYMPAIVNIADSSHNFCDIQNSSRRLKSATSGIARILYKESGTGDKYCVIRIGETSEQTDRGLIKIKNISGADVDQWHVLAIDDPVTPLSVDKDDFLAEPPEFKGLQPDTSRDWGRFCVLQEDIADGATGLARVSGITPVRLELQVTVYSFTRVDIKDASYLAEENWHGAAELLYSETHNSERWGWIRLDTYQAPRYEAEVKAALLSNNQALCEIQVGNPKQQVDVHHRWMTGADFAIGKHIEIAFNRHNNRWQIVEGQCE